MSEPRYKVLLIEDNPGDARLIQESLAGAKSNVFDLEIAHRLSAGVERLRAGEIEAVLLDLSLPESQGPDTFAVVKAVAARVPIIILTGLGDDSLALKLVEEGAQDYIAKSDANGNNLSRAIRYAISRAQAEQQIRKLNSELEERVKERTSELEASIRELEAFSYSVSHDLRAPLRHVDAFVRILAEAEEGQLSWKGLDYIERIQSAVRSMTRIVEALLKLAHVGKEPLHLRKISLNRLVAHVVEELSMANERRQVEWKIEDLPRAECDEDLMKQVLTNLLSNALKYTRPRETAVIRVGQTKVEGQPVIFIRDNGVGFDMKDARKLFGQFQRLHRPEEFEGTGVGLATVERIVKRHGGSIWAEAEVEQGATFYFTGGLESEPKTRSASCAGSGI